MNVKINKLENSQVELEFKIDKGEFNQALNTAFKKNVGKYNIPGFRKGKVPFSVFKQMFGIESLYNDAANLVIDKSYMDAINENKIEVVDYPKIDIVNINENEDFAYKAVVYVRPEVKLGNYKGIEVSEVTYEVTDEDINKEIEEMRNKGARFQSKENSVIEYGDVAVIDFKGFVDEVPFEGGEGTNYNLSIGSNTFIDTFEEQLIGKIKGDEIDVLVTFPIEYHVENLKGKAAKFEVKINDVMKKELPELNDEFAKDYSEFKTLEELSNDIRNKKKENNINKAKYEFENSVIEKVCENAEVYVPEPMIESEITRLVKEFENKIKQQGIDLQKYSQYYGITIDEIRNNFRDRANKQVLSDLVLEKVSKEEEISVSEEQLNEKALELAKMYSAEEEKIDSIKATLLASHRDSLERDLILTKTIEFLVKEAKKS